MYILFYFILAVFSFFFSSFIVHCCCNISFSRVLTVVVDFFFIIQVFLPLICSFTQTNIPLTLALLPQWINAIQFVSIHSISSWFVEFEFIDLDIQTIGAHSPSMVFHHHPNPPPSPPMDHDCRQRAVCVLISRLLCRIPFRYWAMDLMLPPRTRFTFNLMLPFVSFLVHYNPLYRLLFQNKTHYCYVSVYTLESIDILLKP